MGYDSSGNYTPDNKGTGGGGGGWNSGFRNDTDPGDVGTGVWNGSVYQPNASSFANPNDAQNKSTLAQYYNMLGGRSAPSIDAASAGMATGASAAMLGPASTYGGATIDTAQSNAARAYQQRLLDQLQGQANGTAPSVAAMQMQQGLQQNLQQQASLAGSMGGGGNPALAMRNLQYGAAAQNQQLLGQAGMARLQEQQGAEQQLGNVAGAMRGQDIGIASQQAGFAEQAGLASMQAQNQAAMANAGFSQQANLANAAAQNQYGLSNAQMAQQAALANQQSQLGLIGLNQQGQTWDLGQMMGMSESDRQAAEQYEQLMGQQSDTQMGLNEQAFSAAGAARGKLAGGILSGIGGAMALSDARSKKGIRSESGADGYDGLTLSPVDEKTDIADESSDGGGYDDSMSRTNAGGDTGPSRFQVGLGNFFQGLGSGMAGTSPQFAKYQDSSKKKGASPLGTDDPEGEAASHGRASFADHMDQMRQQNAAMMAPSGGGGPGGVAPPAGGSSSGFASMMGGFGGGGGGGDVLSDEDEKSSIKKGASGQLLDPLTPYSYEYKDPGKPGAGPGRHLGVMAQDLERSRYGAPAVVDTSNGKMVDYAKLGPPMLAAEADMHKRLSVVESMLGVGGAHEEGDTTEKPAARRRRKEK